MISDFPNHPFKVRMDEAMVEMAESVKQYGVLVPAMVRPKPEGGYELRTRFYMGWSFDGEKYTYDQNRPVIWELAEGLLLHNVKEYRHLAEILPEVYAEFKDNFRVDLD